jgi:hypothetical protein
MQSTSMEHRGQRLLRFAPVAAGAVLIAIGVGAVVKGLDGRSTVRDALARERITGLATFTPTAIAAEARKAGLRSVALPDCSVAGKPIDDGASARCFAEYMRVDALMGTNGATYAQMPRFASKDGKGTSDEALARKTPDGQPMSNPAREVWVTQTALSNALNTSYMAEQVALFGIAVGAALLLVGLVMAALGLGRRDGRATRAPIPQAGRGRHAGDERSALAR